MLLFHMHAEAMAKGWEDTFVNKGKMQKKVDDCKIKAQRASTSMHEVGFGSVK